LGGRKKKVPDFLGGGGENFSGPSPEQLGSWWGGKKKKPHGGKKKKISWKGDPPQFKEPGNYGKGKTFPRASGGGEGGSREDRKFSDWGAPIHSANQIVTNLKEPPLGRKATAKNISAGKADKKRRKKGANMGKFLKSRGKGVAGRFAQEKFWGNLWGQLSPQGSQVMQKTRKKGRVSQKEKSCQVCPPAAPGGGFPILGGQKSDVFPKARNLRGEKMHQKKKREPKGNNVCNVFW